MNNMYRHHANFKTGLWPLCSFDKKKPTEIHLLLLLLFDIYKKGTGEMSHIEQNGEMREREKVMRQF